MYRESDCSVTIRSSGADNGGGSEVLIVQKVYDPSRRHDYKEYDSVCDTVQAFWGTGGMYP